MNRSILTGLVVGVAVVAAAGGGYLVHDLRRPAVAPAAAPAVVSGTPDALQTSFIAVAQRVRPAVVNVGIVQRGRGRRGPAVPGTEDPSFQDFLRQFFGSEGPVPGARPEFRQPSLGSGVIIDKRGLVLTNYHVVQRADEITVRMSDKREYRGKVMGADPKTDLAVLSFDAGRDLPVAALGDSDQLRVGEWAIAIGNPFGLDQTVTVGVISATGRSDVGVATYENFIQTDASINPGNSGGPLLNLRGEVVGVNTAIVAAGQGIGFAIPINMVRRVVDQLVAQGKVVRGWLGVSVQPLSLELAQSLGLKEVGGALVAAAAPGSPAAAAGLQQNDVIIAYENTQVEDYRHLQRLVAETKVGTKVTLQVWRKKQKLGVAATIAEVPDDKARRPGPEPRG